MPGNYVLLETIDLTQSTASVTFDNLPTSGYTDLKVVISSRQTVSEASAGYYFDVTFNGTTANRSGLYLRNHNGTVTSGTYTLWGLSNPSDYTANSFSSCELYIPNYRSSNFKSASLDSVNENNGTGIRQVLATGLWSNTAAITSITFTPGAGTFDANSTFSLYGVAAVGTTPTIAPKATGGNIVANDGTYWYHSFLRSGTFTPQTSLTCDYLVVAGGGGGGASTNVNYVAGGGGGAGGFRAATGLSVSAQSYTVTVGAGGAGSTSSNSAGTSGGDSVFSTISSTGGGGAGSGAVNNGLSGGSGGGSRGYSGTGGAGNAGGYTPVEGYAGGSATTTKDSGSGGGGASAVGSQAASNFFGGAGGNGATSSISGSSVTYAGGGGGGSYNQNNIASGGTGGGGAGGGGLNPGGTAPVNGTTNLGGGGGGGYANANYVGSNGANGGSGIVIIRYAI